MKTITVEIPKPGEGNIRVQVNGVDGAACEALTAQLEEHLGVEQTRMRSDDYFKNAATSVMGGQIVSKRIEVRR